MQSEVSLDIPGTADFLRLARLAAADLGSRAGLTYEEIEDLRIGVDELCNAVMRPDGEGRVALHFTLDAEPRASPPVPPHETVPRRGRGPDRAESLREDRERTGRHVPVIGRGDHVPDRLNLRARQSVR